MDEPQNRRFRPLFSALIKVSCDHFSSVTLLPLSFLEIDAAEATLKTAIVPKIMAVLPKAARYIQIENKIRAAVRYELAARIPLVE
jgi:hypothetical protein